MEERGRMFGGANGEFFIEVSPPVRSWRCETGRKFETAKV